MQLTMLQILQALVDLQNSDSSTMGVSQSLLTQQGAANNVPADANGVLCFLSHFACSKPSQQC